MGGSSSERRAGSQRLILAGRSKSATLSSQALCCRGQSSLLYFALVVAALIHPQDRKDLNTIDLTQAKLSVSPSDPHTLVLRCSSLGKGKEKDYILSSPDPATTKAWYEAIKTAQESVRLSIQDDAVPCTHVARAHAENVSVWLACEEQAQTVVPVAEFHPL